MKPFNWIIAGASIIGLGIFMTRTKKSQFVLTKEIPTAPENLYTYLREIPTFYEMNRKGYKPIIQATTSNDMKYLLVDDFAGVHFETPIYRKFEERPVHYVWDEWNVFKSYMKVTYLCKPTSPPNPQKTILEVQGEITGPRWSVSLLQLSQKEIGAKLTKIQQKFQIQDK